MAPTEFEAETIAKAFSATLLDVVHCDSPPSGLYGFNATTEYLFAVRNLMSNMLAASDYIAVSRLDGTVRLAGRAGE